MKRKKIILIIACLIIIIFFLDIWRRSFHKQLEIRFYLQQVAFAIRAYAENNGQQYPRTLSDLPSKIAPKEIIEQIKYTYWQRQCYNLDSFDRIYKDTELWFYYPYGKTAWICVDGIVIVKRIPLSEITLRKQLNPIQPLESPPPKKTLPVRNDNLGGSGD